MEAKQGKGRPKGLAVVRECQAAMLNVHQIQLDTGCFRIVQAFVPFDQVRVGDMVLAKVKLFNITYTCRLMDKIPAWRICDREGKYIRVDFPQLAHKVVPNQIHYELLNAPPHCWAEDEAKKNRIGKKVESVPKDKTADSIRARRAKCSDSVGDAGSTVAT